jgi:Ser/Thr protein kinase RdoA (MazF antagonist)
LDEQGYGEVLEEMAQLLGRFHRLSREYDRHLACKPDYAGSVPITPHLKYFEAPLAIGVPHVVEQLPNSQAEVADKLHSTLLGLRGKLQPVLATAPQLVCHNDFYGPNLLMSNGHITGLVDFDFSLSTSHLVDLVEGLHGALISTASTDQAYFGLPSTGLLSLNAGRRFMQAYEQYSGIETQPDHLELFMQVKLLSLTLYPGHLPGFSPEHYTKLISRTAAAAAFLNENRGWLL